MMKSNIIITSLLCISLLFPPAIFSDEIGVAFFLSTPYRSSVTIDDSPLDKPTPFVLTNLSEGQHTATFSAPGFASTLVEFTVTYDEAAIVSQFLESDYVNVAFPGYSELQMRDEIIPVQNSFVALDQGTYSMNRDGGILKIEPFYPREGLIASLNLSSALLFSLSGILAAGALIDPPGSRRSLPIAVITTQATGALLLAASAYVNADKGRYLASYPPLLSGETENALDKDRYERGMKFLSAGKMDDAADEFSAVISSALPSVYYPKALYQQSRIQRFQGDLEAAGRGFQEIIDNHPMPDLYDKCLKGLADLAFGSGNFDASLSRLNAMVFVDPLYSREEIGSYAAEILGQQFSTANVGAEVVMHTYDDLVSLYPNSAQADYYRIQSARFAAFAGDISGAIDRLQSISSDNADYANEIEEIEAIIKQGS